MMKIYYDWKNLEKPGVYEIIVDRVNNYIGETKRANTKRWGEHRRSFYKHTCNRKFKEVLNENSIIEFRMIRTCKSKKECRYWEKHYIQMLNPNLNVKRH